MEAETKEIIGKTHRTNKNGLPSEMSVGHTKNERRVKLTVEMLTLGQIFLLVLVDQKLIENELGLCIEHLSPKKIWKH